MPSFATDSPLDKRIKLDMIYETLALLNLTPDRKKRTFNKPEATKVNGVPFKKAPVFTRFERENLRKKLQEERDKWDLKVCTGYERVYPSFDPVKQELYRQMLDRSNIMFNDFISGIPSRQIYQNAASATNPPRRLSRTNPINKAKAVDLSSQ